MTVLNAAKEGETVPSGGSIDPSTGRRQQQAVWIASYPKSGNTWLRVFLSNMMRELSGKNMYPQSINALNEWSSLESLIKNFDRRLGKPAQFASQSEIAAARPFVQADIVGQSRKPIFIKTHNAVATVAGFPTINFDITRAAIYVIRNPLDVAISYAHHMGISIDDTIDFMADAETSTETSHQKRVYEFMSSWSLHVASWISIPHRPVLILRYEDMLATPERSFGRVAAFLRLNPTSEQLGRAIRNSSFEQLVQQESKHGFKERSPDSQKFFRSGKSGQWKDELSREQFEAIVKTHSPLMMRFGYLNETCGVN